jgi:hypothetical protein
MATIFMGGTANRAFSQSETRRTSSTAIRPWTFTTRWTLPNLMQSDKLFESNTLAQIWPSRVEYQPMESQQNDASGRSEIGGIGLGVSGLGAGRSPGESPITPGIARHAQRPAAGWPEPYWQRFSKGAALGFRRAH